MQNVPDIFRDKVVVDNQLAALKSATVISMAESFRAVRLQRSLRRLCQVSLAMHKVDPDGAGSPMAMAA